MNTEKVYWPGLSGKHYEFEVFDIETQFYPNNDGNYIFAKRTMTGWNAVYIGEGDIRTRTSDEKHRNCAIGKGATHVHAHENNNESDRKDEEEDLLGYNTEAYHPVGCNLKISG